jgi:hypothetical protein
MNRIFRFFIFAFLIPVFIASCDSTNTGDGGGGGGGGDVTFGLEEAFPGTVFDRPVDFQNAGDGTNRVFVVEQKGVIKVVTPLESSSVESASPDNAPRQEDVNVFLDIQDRVFFEAESGLLGLAFHPDYESNGHFYVYYIAADPPRTVISRFSVNGEDADQADQASELVLLELLQPSPDHHKAGQIAFGPGDGYLYIAVGDGGTGGETGQDPTDLLGSILRIDVDNPEDGMSYGIPSDNPFAGNTSGFREEILAYGFRNPWKFAIDPTDGTLFAGDVGVAAREEIDLVEKGKNYGWNIMEGSLCFTPPSGCDTSGLELPIHEYGRDEGGTIILGPIYEGSISELIGKLIYGDFISGTIWALGFSGSSVTDNVIIVDTDEFRITAFGRDEEGEIYVCSLDGIIYRLVTE